jgi:hypothetical protein
MPNSFFESAKKKFNNVKMVGILRKALQLIKSVRGPALKYLAPMLDAVIPGLGQIATVGANQVIDRVSNVYDEYETAKESGQKYGFRDAVKTFIAPQNAVLSKTSEYGGLHPRLELKDE